MARESVLDIVKAVAQRVGISTPTTATGSTDVQVQQLTALANEEGEDLAARRIWTALIKEKTFTLLATESQGALIGTILSTADGFDFILNDTIWNRTTRYPGVGPVTATGWQALKAVPVAGFWLQYRIRGGELLMNPTPTAGNTAAFEYKTENWVSNLAGDTFRAKFTMDDDYPLLDSKLIKAGLLWRWKASKGLEYAEDFAKYENLVADAMHRDGTAKSVSLDGSDKYSIKPVVMVPAGNWMVP